MTLNRIIAIAIPLILFGCGRNTVDPLQSAYHELRSIPQERWDALAGKRIFFGHQSVGLNIINGLDMVMKAEPSVRLNVRLTTDPSALSDPVLAHSPIGQNLDPKGKTDDFRRLLESGIGHAADIAFFKFCYIDVVRKTDIDGLFAHYERTLAELAAEFPNLTIIPVTVPLTNHRPGIKAKIKRLLGRGPAVREDNTQRNLLNARILEKYGQAVWDLAAAEASTGAGQSASFTDKQGSFLLMNPDYTRDGGHLNAVGSQAVAIDLLLKLAEVVSYGN